MVTPRPRPGTQRGFTYMAIMLLVALHGVILSIGGVIWHTASQRDKERELLFAGDQFRRAIRSYSQTGPGLAGQLPRSLDDLLRDPRYPNVKRHLRRIYVDPMTGTLDWGLLTTPDGQAITGVYSRSREAPMKRGGFSEDDRAFEGAASYADWKFDYRPPTPTPRPKASDTKGEGKS